MKLLTFIETNEELEKITEYCRATNTPLTDVHFVALSQIVQLTLRKQGIPYDNTVSYFDRDSHKRCLEHSEAVMAKACSTLRPIIR